MRPSRGFNRPRSITTSHVKSHIPLSVSFHASRLCFRPWESVSGGMECIERERSFGCPAFSRWPRHATYATANQAS
ncbi:MAG: hypothetical protein OJF49_003361 [Ktedonobacterales bacterium]|nr:MAG: hypothetical protein OJF49_003361 [Ktedonobacterales bacterium]